MAMTGSIGFSQGVTSPWVQLQQRAVNMAQVLYVEFEGKGDQLCATLVFSLSKPVSITAASGAGEMGALTLGGADAQAVQKWIFDHRYISLK